MAFDPSASASTHPTISDWAKRLDPDGKIAAIVELMNETNEILQDAVWAESNLPTGHRSTVRVGLPSATWRQLYSGVAQSKSRVQQVEDTIGMLEAYAEVDKDLADLNGNTAAFRLSEDRPFLEAMNQEIADVLFYGDIASYPTKFHGLTPRYDSLGDGGGVGNSYLDHCVDGGDSTASSQTSLWLVVWGMNTVHMIFPKGSKMGLKQQDLGEVTLFDSTGKPYQGYRTHYQWKAGLVVRDWRYIVRIANMNPDAWGYGDGDTPFPYRKIIQAINAIPTLRMGKPVFYCNRALKTQFDLAAAEKTNLALRIDEWAGRPVTTFWGIPIRQCDSLLNTEAVVS